MNKIKKLNEKYFYIIVISIIAITFLHYSTIMSEWEVHIFYRRLYYIPIILSAFKYRIKGGIISSLVISILYAPHLWVTSNNDIILSINQYLEIILFIAIGSITGRLVELDYKKQKLLENKVVEITRLQNYTKNIVDSINSVVISIDNDYNITSVNKEGKKIFKDKLKVGKKLTEIIDEKKFIDALNQVKVQNEPVSRIRIKKEIEEDLFLEFKILPLSDILNRVLGLVVVIENKSDIKFLEAQAERGDRLGMVGELASGVAHEVRNPMGIIKTISQVLQKEVDDTDTKEGLEIIEKEIDRANKVIKSLLDFAKPDTNISEILSINKLIDDVLLITKKFIENKNVFINVDINEEINIIGDKEKLKQVFINLIFNSIQAMPNGGNINLKANKLRNFINISFEDKGIGISSDNLKKIFNPFFTTKYEGTGLGLSISNRIIQDHGGYINIDSNLGKGTKVNMFLPIN